MKIFEIITEQARAPLYHGASVETAEQILQTDTLKGGSQAGWWGDKPGWMPDKGTWHHGGSPRRGHDKFSFDKKPVLKPEDQEFVDWFNDMLKADDNFDWLDSLSTGEYNELSKKWKALTAPIPGKEAKGVSSLSRDKRLSQGFGSVVFVLDQDLLRRDIGKRIHPYAQGGFYPYITRSFGSGESEESVWGNITNFKKYILKVISKEPVDPEKFPLVAQAIKNTESVQVPGTPKVGRW